ncbi:circadian clock KaiB family protein [Mucilaginibacter sp.]|uniref:circadian clock KaiB family protein n=1 Tax=Mucilaginibacter sp. TaxID=1882438 RepID=UPI0025EB6E4E|nr:circadian clock KaiB family protein [Mucilaginibacter sp.]
MEAEKYKLCLYVAGKTQKSNNAIENLKKYCENELKDQYTIEIIDLLEHPHLAEGEQIIAVPSLIKKLPAPMRVLVGDLSDKTKVLVGLNLVNDK